MSGMEIQHKAAKKGRGVAGKGKRGSPSLHIGLDGAMYSVIISLIISF